MIVTPNNFAQKLGYTRSQTIYDILNCKSAPSFDFFNRFQNSEYSEMINIDWLLTGRGSISKKTYLSENKLAENKIEYKKPTICKECELLKEQITALNKLIRSYEKQINLIEEKYECPPHHKKKAS